MSKARLQLGSELIRHLVVQIGDHESKLELKHRRLFGELIRHLVVAQNKSGITKVSFELKHRRLFGELIRQLLVTQNKSGITKVSLS